MNDIIYLIGDKVQEHQWKHILNKYKYYSIGGVISKNYFNVEKTTIEQVKKQTKNPKFLLIGHGWEEDWKSLQWQGYELWKNVIPEWGRDILHDRSFEYEEIKKYTGNNVVEIGKMFAVIAKLAPIATVFGNCHSFFLNKIMEHTDIIKEKYIICYFPFIQDFTDERTNGISGEYLQHIDLFIYQNVGAENKFSHLFETKKYILPYLKKDSLKCSIPFTYFEGYFPQYIPNVRNPGKESDCEVPYGDIKIQTLLEEGKSPSEVAQILQKDNLFSVSELKNNVQRSLNELKKREQECNVGISDYIEENYTKEHLFYSPSHPVTAVLVELMRRVYAYLGIKDYLIQREGIPENDSIEMLIYPSVKKHLGLRFAKKTFSFNKRIDFQKSDIENYVEKYRACCFPELSYKAKKDERSMFLPHLLSLDTRQVKERHIKKVFVSGRKVMINLYLNVVNDNISGNIGKILELYAPQVPIVFNAALTKSNRCVPITIDRKGNLLCNIKNCKYEILLLNAVYFMK